MAIHQKMDEEKASAGWQALSLKNANPLS